MTRSSAIAILATASLSAGCSGSSAPTAPSAVVSPVGAATSAAGAGAGASTAAAATPQLVPFHGRFEGSQSVTPIQPPLALVDGMATGTGTHLGQFTVTFPHTVNFATASAEGTYTFTAANGATVIARFTGQAQVGPITTIVETATITGGTGRFAGASGTFVAHRVFDRAAGTTTGNFEGSIALAQAAQP